MIKIITTHSGYKSVIKNGIALHSHYDPVREAKRFIQNSIKDEKPSLILLLGAGIGYIVSAIRELYPSTKLIAVFYNIDIFNNHFAKKDLYWHFTDGVYWVGGECLCSVSSISPY